MAQILDPFQSSRLGAYLCVLLLNPYHSPGVVGRAGAGRVLHRWRHWGTGRVPSLLDVVPHKRQMLMGF